MERFYAHTARTILGEPDPNEETWQLLKDHLLNVAMLAETFAAACGLSKEAFIAGILHDLGKYSRRFQFRLRDHTITGINHWGHGTELAYALSPLAGFAIDGHHTGIPSAATLQQTLFKLKGDPQSITGYDEQLPAVMQRLLNDNIKLPSARCQTGQDKLSESMRVRFLFSCLVDADYLDTEQHFSPHRAELRQPAAFDFDKALAVLLQVLKSKSDDSHINKLRGRLLKDCLAAAEQPPGLFTLTAPTGSGKTLASLAFALRHMAHHNAKLEANDPDRLRRIIVVIPYTSIIEQTARVYRKILEGHVATGSIVEHHSTAIAAATEEVKQRFAIENWDAPVIITTNAQFFQSLYSNRPSACRKLHNIARSVVLFDEVQTLPARLVPSLLSGVKLLTQDYGATAVFMTATQPAFSSIGPSLRYGWSPTEISSCPNDMAEALKRTNIILPKPGETMTWAEVATKMQASPQALCVVNSTRDARKLFNLLPEASRYHLSARMCPAHRHAALQEIKLKLDTGAPVYLISTQVIEAGVDIDFPLVFRAMGPLDSIIQTAGRGNREGKSATPCQVIVFVPEDGTMPRGVYQTATDTTVAFLSNNPGIQLHLPQAYEKYFAELYKLVGPAKASADQVVKLSEAFDFPAAAEACRLIEENTHTVLVPWGDSASIVSQIQEQGLINRATGRKLQRFSVNLYDQEFQKGLKSGLIEQPIEDLEFYILKSSYDPQLGACTIDEPI